MAKATKRPDTTRLVVVKGGITLELSSDEVDALRAILYSVGGDPVNSPRKHADAIHNALADAGAGTRNLRGASPDHPARLSSGFIKFEDYPKAAYIG